MAFSESLIMAGANSVPRTVQGIIRLVAGSDTLLGWTGALMRRAVRRVKQTNRIAVVSDTNIGDAVVLQGACSGFKRWLPGCKIDYFYQRRAEPLLKANPNIDGHFPVFTDPDFTSKTNCTAVQNAMKEREYGLILNLYPFLMNSELAGAGCPVLAPYRLLADIIRTEQHPTAKAHVAYHLRRYVDSVARRLAGLDDAERAESEKLENLLYLAEDVPERAREVLRAVGVEANARLAFLNPDSSSRFSRIPTQIQVELVRGLLELDHFDYVLLGPAFSFPEVVDELCGRIAGHRAASKLLKLPRDIAIDTYAGLIDCSDLFVTSDTAQMHIAAARRVTPGREDRFRNRTALVTIFGATNSRIHGYDSFSPGHLDSNQDAAAKVFEGAPPCKNITCIHKTGKTCRTVKCFSGVSSTEVLAWIERAPIIIVSGLPRSGTSLMMQMLEAGGVTITTDGVRMADADNPRGYYELEKVKHLGRDGSWLSECGGKAIKIISMLLPELPKQHEYRIIFMERRLPEVLASQKKMLSRRGQTESGHDDGELAAGYERHLASLKTGLANRPNVRTLYVSYHETLKEPRRIATQVGRFLKRELRTHDMVTAVDGALYRNKDEGIFNHGWTRMDTDLKKS